MAEPVEVSSLHGGASLLRFGVQFDATHVFNVLILTELLIFLLSKVLFYVLKASIARICLRLMSSRLTSNLHYSPQRVDRRYPTRLLDLYIRTDCRPTDCWPYSRPREICLASSSMLTWTPSTLL